MMKELFDHEYIIFAMDHYNPLGLARSLGEVGINSINIAEKSKTDIFSYSKVDIGTDGFRGKANVTLTFEHAIKIG